MSLAFSTLVIVLFGVLPGAVFELSLYSGKMARVRAPTPTLTDVAVAVGLSLPIHLFVLLVVEIFSPHSLVDYSLFLRAVTGQFGEDGRALGSLARSFEAYRGEIAGYLLTTLAVALFLGQVVQYVLLLASTADRLFPFRNEWFYRFFFPGGKRITACTAFVLATTNRDKSPLLYRGFVADFRVRLDGSLAELMLREPSRTELLPVRPDVEAGRPPGASVASRETAVSWLPLPQDAFVIPGEQIANLSLAYTRAWQPIWLLAHRQVQVSRNPSTGLELDLLGKASMVTRALYRIVKKRVRIIVQPVREEGRNLTAHVEPKNPRRVTLKASDGAEDRTLEHLSLIYPSHWWPSSPGAAEDSILARLFLVWIVDQDSRSGQTGNLIFSIHQRLIKALATRTDRKIEEARKALLSAL